MDDDLEGFVKNFVTEDGSIDWDMALAVALDDLYGIRDSGDDDDGTFSLSGIVEPMGDLEAIYGSSANAVAAVRAGDVRFQYSEEYWWQVARDGKAYH